MNNQQIKNLTEAYNTVYEQQIGVPLKDASDRAAKEQLQKMIPKGEKVHTPKSSLQNAGYEPEGELVDEAEVLAMRGGVPGSVKVRPALSIPGTSIGVGPNKPVPGTFTTTTPEQRARIQKGDTTIDRGTYQQPRQGAGPTAGERERYNKELARQGKHSAPRMREDVDVFDEVMDLLLDEGFSTQDALDIMATMTESILEMSDFEAGGGNAKMKKTGMSRSEVEALGKKNQKSSEGSSKRQDATERRRERERDALASGAGSPVRLRARELAQKREKDYENWEKNRSWKAPGGYKGLAGS